MNNANITYKDLMFLEESLEAIQRNLKEGNIEGAEYRTEVIKRNLGDYIVGGILSSKESA